MSEIALKLIHEAKQKRLKTLDLSNCGLTELPEELFELDWLEAICFSIGIPKAWFGNTKNKGGFNKISQESLERLHKLKNLKKLDFTNTMGDEAEINDLTILSKVKSLEHLHLSCNYITDLNAICELKNLRYLDLEDNQISDISPLINLPMLEYLNLRNNNITEIDPISSLVALVSLYLGNFIEDEEYEKGVSPVIRPEMSNNDIKDICPLKSLNNIKSLDLRGNEIQDFKVFNELRKLEWLDISANLLETCPDLTGIKSLRTLHLNYNRLKDIKPLGNLYSLKSLDISFNEINDISPLKGLIDLETLSIEINQITDLSPIRFLHKLKSLRSNNNKIESISPLLELKNLEKIELANNNICGKVAGFEMPMLDALQLRANSIEIIEHNYFPSLRYLDIGENQLSDIEFLSDYPTLETLGVDSNHIKDIKVVLYLEKIRLLWCNDNQITHFPLDIASLNFLSQLKLHNNPIGNIPKYLFQDNKDCYKNIKSYYQDLQDGYRTNDKLKILLIGNGHVGKTCLLKQLTKGLVCSNEEKSTHGIQIERWAMPNKGGELLFWDFGGQDIYYATHRIFMQTEAIFLLVWDYENEYKIAFREEVMSNGDFYTFENQPLSYWLSYSRHLGKNSPVLVVQTKIDAKGHKRQYPAQTKSFEEKFNILGFLSVDNLTGRGISALKSHLLEEVETILLNQPLIPKTWYEVRQAIWETAKKEKFISMDNFSKICLDCSLPDSSQETLLEYLHNSGVLFYKKNYFNSQIILDQQWVIDIVYTIFRRDSIFYELVREKKGEFSVKHLNKEVDWRERTDKEKSLLLDFMMSTHICFQKPGTEYLPLEEKVYVAPQLLPVTYSTDAGDWIFGATENGYQIRIEFDFFHFGIIQSLIFQIARIKNVDIREIWKTGIRIAKGNIRMLVSANIEDKSVIVYILDRSSSIRPLFSDIQKSIHKGLENEASDSVHFFISYDNHEFVPLNLIKENYNLREFSYKGKYYRPADYHEFLPLIGHDKVLEVNEKPIIYLSYVNADSAYKNEIRKHLKNIQLEVFSRDQIPPGMNEGEYITQKFGKAKIIICLLSADYFNDNGLGKMEVDLTLQRIKDKMDIVVPVLIKPCDIDSTGFKGLKLIPDFSGIANHDMRENVYLEIVKVIKDHLIDKV